MKVKCHYCGIIYEENWKSVLRVSHYNMWHPENKLYPTCPTCLVIWFKQFDMR